MSLSYEAADQMIEEISGIDSVLDSIVVSVTGANFDPLSMELIVDVSVKLGG